MALAGAITWVMIGIIYIIYKGFREYPTETATVIGSIILFFVIFLPPAFILHSIEENGSDTAVIVSHLLCLVILCVALYKLIKSQRKEKEETTRRFNEKVDISVRTKEIIESESYESGPIREDYAIWLRAQPGAASWDDEYIAKAIEKGYDTSYREKYKKEVRWPIVVKQVTDEFEARKSKRED